jgi:hypothetical protein
MHGFYYHYKRTPEDPIEKSVYQVVGTAFNTESPGFHASDPKDFEKDEVVVYRPVFTDSLVYKAGKRFWTRPLSMFFEEVLFNGKRVSRFQKITDPKIILVLQEKVKKLYDEN